MRQNAGLYLSRSYFDRLKGLTDPGASPEETASDLMENAQHILTKTIEELFLNTPLDVNADEKKPGDFTIRNQEAKSVIIRVSFSETAVSISKNSTRETIWLAELAWPDLLKACLQKALPAPGVS